MRSFPPSYGPKDAFFLAISILTICLLAIFFALHRDHQAFSAYCRAIEHAKEESCKLDKPFMEVLIEDPAAFFTAVLAALTLVLALVGVAQVYFLLRADETSRRAADAAKQAADLARDTLIAGQRAWIKVGTPEGKHSLRARGPGLILDLPVTIKNIGNIPAIDISVVAWFDFTWINEKDRESYVDRFETERVKANYLSPTLFPEELESGSTEVICSVRAEWGDVRHHITSAGTFEIVVPALVGCVSYGFPTDTNMRHQTRFAFYMHTGAAVIVEQSR